MKKFKLNFVDEFGCPVSINVKSPSKNAAVRYARNLINEKPWGFQYATEIATN